MSRPEDTLSADIHYNDAEARKYTTSSRIQSIQASMTRRALEILDLRTPSLILDVGCGSGLSGEILSAQPAEEGGPHAWIGIDVAAAMLDVALQRDVEGDLLLADMGQGVPFRPGTFDAAVSISAVQWLCNAETSDTSPQGRLSRFFTGLYQSLRRGGRAVCQFYPKNDAQRDMITQAAARAGFGVGLMMDDEGTKNFKLYLVLTAGASGAQGGGDVAALVEGMDGVEVTDERRTRRGQKADKEGEIRKGSRAWIIRQKEQMERKGKIAKTTSRYTGRRRRVQF